MEELWDCIVVGGGAAGLSAALVLGRARQRTLVVDAGGQSNREAHGIGGMLGQDGRPPAAFYAAGREELAGYPTVELRSGEVVGGERHDSGFVLELGDGSREAARRVLLATGMDYRFPALPGIAERWGRSVFHCPFCHGWEVRDRPLAVLDRGVAGMRRALLLRVWSDDVTLLADGPAELDAKDVERLRGAGGQGRRAPRRRAPRPGQRLDGSRLRRRRRTPMRRPARACHPAPTRLQVGMRLSRGLNATIFAGSKRPLVGRPRGRARSSAAAARRSRGRSSPHSR